MLVPLVSLLLQDTIALSATPSFLSAVGDVAHVFSSTPTFLFRDHVASLRPTLVSSPTLFGGPHDDSSYAAVSSAWLLADGAGAVSDGVRNAALGFAAVSVAIFAVGTYVARSAVPEQLNNMALLVRDRKPEVWETITAELREGERVRDRTDLVVKLTDAALELMKEETDDEMARMVVLIREQVKDEDNNAEAMAKLRPFVETTVECSLEEFVAKVDKNSESKFLSDSRRELSELLKTEFSVIGATLADEEDSTSS